MKELAADFLRLGLGMVPQPPLASPPSDSMVTTGNDGLPLIRCMTDAPASRMNTAELLLLEQDALAAEDTQRIRLLV